MRKRLKTASPLCCQVHKTNGTLNPLLFQEEFVEKKNNEYETSQPYQHILLKDVCDDRFLSQALRELETHVTLSFKETDLFKVLQSVDLASLDTAEGRKKCTNLTKLRDALYSDTFRRAVERMTGCPPLDARVDCSCNVYPHGGHLLCHDDVIGTRCISYILYLSDNQEEWTVNDGGALELYPVSKLVHATPSVHPTKKILPLWNTMILFRVQAGQSFHAVQEVFAKYKSRVSISGWYHVMTHSSSATRNASAQALVHGMNAYTETTHTNTEVKLANTCTFMDTKFSPTFGREDRVFLREWLNDAYLDMSGMLQLNQQLDKEGIIVLGDFLNENIAKIVREKIKLSAANGSGCLDESSSTRWVTCGPPHIRRFLRYCHKETKQTKRDHRAELSEQSMDLPSVLTAICDRVFHSSAFRKWLASVIGAHLRVTQGQVRCFRPGLDYTLAIQNPTSASEKFSLNLCFVNDFGNDDEKSWSSGDVGGYLCHMKTKPFEKMSTPAEVYMEENEEKVSSVDATFNTLTIIKEDENIVNFIKYISKSAPSCRWDIISNATRSA